MRLRITLLLLMACPALAHAADDAPPPRPIPPSGGVPSVLIPDDSTCGRGNSATT